MSSAAAASAAGAAIDPALALASAEHQVQVQQQQLQQQHAEMQRLMAEHQAVQARLLESERAVAFAAADRGQARNGQASAPRLDLPKIPLPDTFNGTNGPAVDSWIHGMEKQFTYHAHLFPSEERKIAYASNYLNRLSSAWLTNLNVELARPGRVPIASWVELTEHMRERFQPMQSATIARQKLDVFVQKTSVQAYVDHFYSCMIYIKDMNEADQIYQFLRGLKSSIRLEVMRQTPDTVNEAINCAVKAESYLGLSGPVSLTGPSRYPRFSQQSNASSNSGHAAMDINNVEMSSMFDDSSSVFDEDSGSSSSSASAAAPPAWAAHIQAQTKMNQKILALFGDKKKFINQKSSGASAKGHIPNITKDIFEQCRIENRCLKCKKPGHFARECTGSLANL